MKLRKEPGLIDVFCIATGAMVSSGIFVLPGLAHAKAGPSVILSYLIAGVLAGIGMLNAAELATAMPKARGDYFFITRTFSPMLMLLRQGTPGGIPIRQPWAGLLAVALTALFFVWVGARIFRVGILMQRMPPKLRNIVRWAIRG